jgi:tetratricopeptide (TPR) repeat protein
LEQGYEEMLRKFREVVRHMPCTRMSTLGETGVRTAERRILDVRGLGTVLRGDLDWIVLRCLEKDRTRRYETASGLALDIDRHLKGETVLAAPPSASYRLSKAVRRHRGACATGAVVAVALVIGLVSTLWQANIAAQQRDLAHSAAASAEQRAQQLKHVSQFQAQMLEGIDATETGVQLMHDLRSRHAQALSETPFKEDERRLREQAFAQELPRINATDAAAQIVVETLLEPAVAASAEQFGDQPLVDATLRQTLANLYTKLGRYDEALELQQWTLDTRVRLLGEANSDTLRSFNDMGDLLDKQGKHAEAGDFTRTALEGLRKLLGEDDPLTVIALGNLGGNYRFQGKYDEALPLLLEALERSRRVNGKEHRDTLIRMNVLGFVLVDQGKYAEAEPYWRETYELGRRALGSGDKDTIVWTNNLGGLLGAMGRRAESEALYREAAETSRRVFGVEHPFTLTAQGNVGSSLKAQGRYAEAEPILRETLEIRLRTLGAEHPDTLDSMSAVGSLLRLEGKLSEAEVFLRDTVQGKAATLGRAHPSTLNAMSILAGLLGQVEQVAEAEALHRRW